MTGSYGKWTFKKLFFQSDCTIFYFHQHCMRLLVLSHSYKHVVRLQNFSHSNKPVIVSHCSFDLRFLMTNDVGWLPWWFRW